MANERAQFIESGFKVVKDAVAYDALEVLEQAYQLLSAQANGILGVVKDQSISLGDYYHNHPQDLIVVPEANNPNEVCRFEYLVGYSKGIRAFVAQLIKPVIEDLAGESLSLFKDKCNLKHPGGGAFSPHQDMAAYYHFGPTYFVTAAVFLDDATRENGCLEMAGNYRQEVVQARENVESLFGDFPFLDFYDGGPKNGDIQDHVCRALSWEPVEACRGDLVLFDAFVPHRSQANHSQNKRRVCFFTFNAASEGDHYEAYYHAKFSQYDDPKFHVSTPTLHRGH